MRLDILKNLSADISAFEAQVRADLKARLAANADALSAPVPIGLQPYEVPPGTEVTNLLGELAEPGTVFMANTLLSAAQRLGPVGPYSNAQGKTIPSCLACVSTALLGSGDQTVVYPTPDAIYWLPRAGVHRLKVIKTVVPGVPTDALLVQEFGLPVKGQGSGPWILSDLNLPEELMPRLQLVLMALKPVHQAVAMAAIRHPGLSKTQAAGDSAHPLELGVTAAMRLETAGLERDQVSLARLACLISELGAMSESGCNLSDPIAQALGVRVDQADRDGVETADRSDANKGYATFTSGDTCAHPRTVTLLNALLERFAQVEPQDAAWLRDLFTGAVHQNFRIGSRNGPLAKQPVNPIFAAMAEPLVCALRYARQSLFTTQSAQRPLFEHVTESVEKDTGAANDTNPPVVAPTGKNFDAGVLIEASCNDDIDTDSDSDGDLLDLAALLANASDPPSQIGAIEVTQLGDLRSLDRDRRGYEDRFLPWPRPSLAWAAGMLDGDGCVAIVRQTYPHRNPNYRLVVQVCQNCLQTLKHFRQSVGVPGLIHEVKRRIGHNRQVYTLNYSGPKAVLVLERLRAHLVRKRPEAEVALSFIQKGQVGRRFGPHGVPPQLEAIRTSHYNKLRALK